MIKITDKYISFDEVVLKYATDEEITTLRKISKDIHERSKSNNEMHK